MSPNKALIIISLLIIAALGGVGYAGYLVKKEYQSWQDTTDKLAVANHKSEDISVLKQNVEQSKDKLTNLNDFFVDNTNLVNFIESLEKLGKDTGVSLVVNNAESGEKMRINFRAQGSFPNIYLFTVLLEKLHYQISIDNLNMSLFSQSEGKIVSWVGDYTITVLSYQKQ